MSETGKISLTAYVLTVRDVARLTGITEAQLYHIRERIPGYRLGRIVSGHWKFCFLDVMKLKAANVLVERRLVTVGDALLLGEHVAQRAATLSKITGYIGAHEMHAWPPASEDEDWKVMHLPVGVQAAGLEAVHLVFGADALIAGVLQAAKEFKPTVDGRALRWRKEPTVSA